MWRFLLLFLPVLSAAGMTAQEAFEKGMQAEAALSPRDAILWFRQADALEPNQPKTLQRISRQLSDLTPLTENRDEKRRLAAEALVYAKRALELDPKSAEIALSVAICYGKLGLYSDTRTKVENSRLVKTYAEKALALDPNYDWAHHVLGRWHYEVNQLGATKRLLVRLIYGALPDASLETAVFHLNRSVELAPDVLAHHIELGFAQLAAGRKSEARQLLAHGVSLPSREIYDEPAKARAREALANL
jgi:tetratricopeptide (TPR) repeat protein